MINLKSRSFAVAIAIATLAVVTGCSSSPQPNYYLLKAPAKGQNAELRAGPTVLLQSVTLPDHLKRSEVIFEPSGNTVAFSTLDRWAEPLERNISDVIVSVLGGRYGAANVFDRWAGFTSRPDIVVRLDIGQMAVSDDSATLSASWELSTKSDEKPQLFSYQSQTPVSGFDASSKVGAIEQAIVGLAMEIEASINEVKGQ
ncbi:MAG: ABC-type transport auxiliary lipoprotein family protein [Erythrobacter sp.]